MTEPMDSYDFISENGKSFFNTDARNQSMMVRITVNVLVSENDLRDLRSECARRAISLSELFGEMARDRSGD